MMCVDAIQRVKQLSKEIRVNQSLQTTNKRKIPQREMRLSKSLSALSPVRASRAASTPAPAEKFKHSTLANIQEDMKNDFQTA